MEKTGILLKIAAAFFLLIAICGASVLTWRDFRDSSSMTDAYAQGQKELRNAGQNDAEAKKTLDEHLERMGAKSLPSGAALRTGGMFAALAAIFSLTILILMFITSRGVLFKVAGSLVVLSVVMILMNPQYETGIAGAASARNVAIIVGILTIIGAVLAMLGARARPVRMTEI